MHSAFIIVQLSHPCVTTGETIDLIRWTFVGKIMSLFFDMLFKLVISFLPRNKCLLSSWLQSPSAVTLEHRPPNKASHCFHCFPIYLPWRMGPDAMKHSQPKSWELRSILLGLSGFLPWAGGGSSASGNPERTTRGWWAEEPGYTEALQERAGSLNAKGSLLITENQISQAEEFSTFVCLVRSRSLGSVNSSPRRAPQLVWGECPVCTPGAPQCSPRERLPLEAAGWQASSSLSLPGSRGLTGPLRSLLTGTFFVYCIGGKSSISHDLWPLIVLMLPRPSRPSAQCSRSSKYLSNPLL